MEERKNPKVIYEYSKVKVNMSLSDKGRKKSLIIKIKMDGILKYLSSGSREEDNFSVFFVVMKSFS